MPSHDHLLCVTIATPICAVNASPRPPGYSEGQGCPGTARLVILGRRWLPVRIVASRTPARSKRSFDLIMVAAFKSGNGNHYAWMEPACDTGVSGPDHLKSAAAHSLTAVYFIFILANDF